MSASLRKILVRTAQTLYVVLFFVCATFIIAIANGYTFNTQYGHFEATGIINVTTRQTPVTVNINGKKKLYKKSPIKLGYLKPGQYTLEITKQGYVPWLKTVTLHSGEVIIHPSVSLFLSDSTPTQATQSQIAYLQTRQKPVENEFDIRGTELWVKPIARTYPFLVASDQYQLIGRYVSPIYDATWLPGRYQLVFQVENQIRVIDRDGGNDIVLASLKLSEATNFALVNDGKTLLYQDGEQVYQRQLQP